MSEDFSKVSLPDAASAAAAAVALSIDHGDALIGGTRRDLLELAAVLRSEILAGGGVLPMAFAWRVGAAHHYRGEYTAALAYFEAAAADTGADPVDRARFLAGHASVLWAQGRADDGRRIAEQAMAAAQACGDDGALGAAWVADGLVQAHAGDRSANLLAYEKALAHAERAGDAITVVRVRNNLGSRHVEAGRYGRALEELDHAVAVSEDHLVGLASAMVSVNRAEALLGLGRLDEAVGEISLATEQFRRAEAAHLLAFALLLEADAHRVRGNAARAHAKYREAVERAEVAGNAQVLGPAMAGLAETAVADDPVASRAHAKRALDQPHTVGDVLALRAAGWVALGQGDLEAAEMWATRALAEAGRRDQLAELADAIELRALTRWSSTGDAHDALGQLAEAGDAWREVGSAIRSSVNRVIIARPPGKKPVSISQLSGGEKAMTCISLLMSIFKSKPSPFCILDEVDAALDEANNQRFNLIVQEFLEQSQFIIITHSKRTMQIADVLYGVTMQEQGVSKRVSVKFDQIDSQGRINEQAAA